MNDLKFKELRQANVARLASSKYRICEETWQHAHWVQALVGEVGEMANILKKVDRGDYPLMIALPDIAKELADIQCYLDILAFKLGIDLGAATVAKFNEVSDRIGSLVKLQTEPVETILGYTKDGKPIYPCEPDRIYTAAVISCARCHKVISGMGGPMAKALCPDCWEAAGL